MSLTIIFFKDKPPTPSSHSQEIEHMDFISTLKTLSKSRTYIF